MLSHHTIDKLEAMGLGAMAAGLRQQMEEARIASDALAVDRRDVGDGGRDRGAYPPKD